MEAEVTLEKLLLMLVSAIVGYVVKWVLPGGTLWDTRWVKDRQTRIAHERLTAEIASNTGTLTIGKYTVRDIAAVQIFTPPVHRLDVIGKFSPNERPLPSELRDLEFDYLNRRIATLREQNKTVDFNPVYALRALTIARPERSGRRMNRPEFTFEPSNFKEYLLCNDALDRPVFDSPPYTIRQRYLAELMPFDWSRLRDVPFHMWFATVTAVVTSDEQLVIALRSDMQAITEARVQGTWRGAMSAAEGMFRPADSIANPPHEEPSPFQTASRALGDELGLAVGRHFNDSDLAMIALAFDLKRFQPVAVFLTKLYDMIFADVYETWQTAKDRQENSDLVAVPITSDDLARVLTGRVKHGARPIHLFSNHQQVGVLIAALSLVGVPAMTAALRRRAA